MDSRISFILLTALTTMSCAVRPPRPATIPLPNRAPWASVFQLPGFRIAADTEHVEHVSTENAVLVWFITVHDELGHTDSLTFNRSRIRLLVRCKPLAFRSVSQELALDDARPRLHNEWVWSGPSALAWRVPEERSTDDEFLRRTCTLLGTPAG